MKKPTAKLRPCRIALTLGWLILVNSFAEGADPPPAVTIRAGRPDRDFEALLNLFHGAKVAHPAAALSAWKRASAEPSRLGKPLEALIATFNPSMAQEFRSLEAAEIALGFDPATGQLLWRASLPRDDGTFAAAASALVLTTGQADAPLGPLAVDRVGKPGSALMTRSPQGLAIASTRDGLTVALQRLIDLGPIPPEPRPGWLVQVDPSGLAASSSLPLRQLAELIRARGLDDWTLQLVVEGTDLVCRSTAKITPESPPYPINPSWLTWIPSDRAMAALVVSIDGRAEAWDAAFALLDRVEHVDPARANVAPSRLRLDLVARAAGIRPDLDVRPHLRGLTAWVGSGVRGISGAAVVAHLADEPAAVGLESRIRKGRPNANLGEVAGQPIRLTRNGSALLFTWGDGVLDQTLQAHAAANVVPILPAPPTDHVGFLWPSRIPGLIPNGSPLATAIADGGPILWRGSLIGREACDEVRWPAVDAVIRRFLDRIPLAPPFEH